MATVKFHLARSFQTMLVKAHSIYHCTQRMRKSKKLWLKFWAIFLIWLKNLKKLLKFCKKISKKPKKCDNFLKLLIFVCAKKVPLALIFLVQSLQKQHYLQIALLWNNLPDFLSSKSKVERQAFLCICLEGQRCYSLQNQIDSFFST